MGCHIYKLTPHLLRLYHYYNHQQLNIITAGGRVLAITGMGSHLQQALDKAYEGANSVCWNDIYYRKDIGQDLLALE